MTLSTGAIVGIVIGSVLVFLLLVYLYLRWYTWRKAQRVNPDIPRVKIDPKEYAGKWYEIARYPQWYEQGCSDVTATYTPEGNAVRVVNKCFRDDHWTTARGWAYPTKSDGVFGVEFFPGIYGNYTVTYRDPETSMVTNSDRTNLWILSRKPSITRAKKHKLLQWLQKEKFDTQPLYFTPQCQSETCKT